MLFLTAENIPHAFGHLGVCLGMQCAVIDFARTELGLEKANSGEFDKATAHKVVSASPFRPASLSFVLTVLNIPGNRHARAYDGSHGRYDATWTAKDNLPSRLRFRHT